MLTAAHSGSPSRPNFLHRSALPQMIYIPLEPSLLMHRSGHNSSSRGSGPSTTTRYQCPMSSLVHNPPARLLLHPNEATPWLRQESSSETLRRSAHLVTLKTRISLTSPKRSQTTSSACRPRHLLFQAPQRTPLHLSNLVRRASLLSS